MNKFIPMTKNGPAYDRYKTETKAILMVCDTDLTPVKAYTQSGSYGGIIKVENSRLLWDACEITSAYAYGEGEKYNGVVLIASAKTCVINEKGALEERVASDNVYAMEGIRMDEMK